MKRLITSFFSTLVLSGTPALADDTAGIEQGFEKILELGNALHAHDQAAWLGTDAFMTTRPDGFDMGSLRGYIITPLDTGLRIAFIAEGSEGERVVWKAKFEDKTLTGTEWLAAPRPMTEAEAARHRAIQTGVSAVTEVCPDRTPLNTAVLDAPEGGLYVYYLTPMRAMDEAVFGRHIRAHVSADGRTLIGLRSFTKSCAIFPANAPDGSNVEMIVTSHILDDVPQETHVFVSRQHDMPVYVVIPDGDEMFAVTGDRIRIVESE